MSFTVCLVVLSALFAGQTFHEPKSPSPKAMAERYKFNDTVKSLKKSKGFCFLSSPSIMVFSKSSSLAPIPNPNPIPYRVISIVHSEGKYVLFADGKQLFLETVPGVQKEVVCDLEARNCKASFPTDAIEFSWNTRDDGAIIGTFVYHADLAFYKTFYRLLRSSL